MKKTTKIRLKLILANAVVLFFILLSPFSLLLSAQAQSPDPNASNPNSDAFRLVICDGPAIPQKLLDSGAVKVSAGYVPCNFRGLMLQVNHLITVLMVLGVFVAIGSFVYAGYIYMSGGYNDKSRAKDIFVKVGVGFIIMLSAWFVVYQLVNWLTGANNPYTKLLGTP